MKKILAVLLLSPVLARAEAAPDVAYAYVSALQPPAWITVKDRRNALGSSTPIPAGATLVTGSGARVHVALADGSLLKLGGDSTLTLSSLQLRTGKPSDTLSITLKLSQGALRYAASKPGSIRNDLMLQIGRSLSAQTTAADLLAEAGSDADRLSLLGGSLTLTPVQKPSLTMAQAQTVYTAHRKPKADDGLATQPSGTNPATAVELASGLPALQSNGPYRIVLALYAEEERAQERVRRYTELGYPAELQRPTQTLPAYRVILEGLSNADDAKRFADVLKQRLKIVNPQVESLMQ